MRAWVEVCARTRSYLSTIVACVIAGLLIAPFLVVIYRTPAVFEAGFFLAGRVWLQSHVFEAGAAYPPGIPLIFAGLEALLGPLSLFQAVLFQGGCFIVGAMFWWSLLASLFQGQKYRFIVFFCSLINPYFLWLVLTSKDTVFEWLATTAFFFFLFALLRATDQKKKKSYLMMGLIIFSFAFGLLVRVLLAPLLGGTLVVAFFLAPIHRLRLGIILATCVLVTAGFIGYQRVTYGYTGLSSTFGFNFYLGQHPLYEYTHPEHDIDVFLSPVVAVDVPDGYSTFGDQAFQRRAVAEIRAHPLRFVAVSLRKTIWHWFNFEKIPNLSANTRLLFEKDQQLEISIDTIRSAPSLLYSLYKLLYIPAFIISLFFWIERRASRSSMVLFLVPLLVLWPIVVLTFPDTRFKIVAEVLAVAFIAFELRIASRTRRILVPQTS